MEAMEKGVAEDIDIATPKGVIKSRIGGIIDRIDSKEGTLRIVDYKTGGSPKTPTDVASLFIPSEARPNYIFQTFLYAAIMQRKQPLKVAPALLYIHRAASEDYSPVIEMGEARKEKIPVDDFSVFEEEFRESLDSCSVKYLIRRNLYKQKWQETVSIVISRHCAKNRKKNLWI